MKNLAIKKKAGFGIRFVAWLIDAVILGVAMGIVGQFLIFPFSGESLMDSVGFLIGPLYAILLWVNWNGQTLGKKAMKIKVVREDGKALDYKVAVLRYLGYIVSSLVFCLGFFWVIWDKEKQGWHDKIAGTFVTKE